MLRHSGVFVAWMICGVAMSSAATGPKLGSSFTNAVGVKLVWIPGGTFRMGSPENELGRGRQEGPVHEVHIARGYWMGAFEVTQEEYEKVIGSNPSRKRGRRLPVVDVSWRDAQVFCLKLTALERGAGSLPDGCVYRLPTEAEWEYACRAGTETPFNVGATVSFEQANVCGRYPGRLARRRDSWTGVSPGPGPNFLTAEELVPGDVMEVGHFPANAFGLFDMHGNVEEWCEEEGHDSYVGAPTDGTPWRGGGRNRIVRSSAWCNSVELSRSAARHTQHPQMKTEATGFRVVCGCRFGPERPGPAGTQSAASVCGTTSVNVAPSRPPAEKPVDRAPGSVLTNSIGMEFSWIPPGAFMMGSPDGEREAEDAEKPLHRVEIRRGFWLGKCEVTQRQWQAVMKTNPSHFKGETLPVEGVSWDDCQEFASKLGALEANDRYRLPTEAEWEYACRAGCTEPRYGDVDAIAWYDKKDNDYRTHPVGEKVANAWGLHDMLGNVWEWCQDEWHDNYKGAPSDGSAWESGGWLRVRRGCSTSGWMRYQRAAQRKNLDPPCRMEGDLGLRLVRCE